MTLSFSANADLSGPEPTGLGVAPARPRPTSLKPVSSLLLGVGLMLIGSAANADQYMQAADNARIECEVSRRELTRIALIGDQFASVSKVSSGNPYSDFAVSNEPVRGDIYLSVPPSFAGSAINFFAASKKGYVYKFACRTAELEAQQIFVTNPALAVSEASTWENESTPADAAIRLVRAMAADETLSGFSVQQAAGTPSRVGQISVQLIAEYRGAALQGRVLRITNLGLTQVQLNERDIAPQHALAVSLTTSALKPGEVATAFVALVGGEK